MTEIELRAAICEAGRRLWQRGLIGGAEGNLSARISPHRLLFTPSGASKGHLRPDQLLITDLHGVPQGPGKPSSEIRMHLAIYAARPDCQAVVHAHPPYATAFALAGEDIPDCLTPEAAVILGSVATVGFAMPGTDELPAAMQPLLADHKAFLLSHHGATTLGRDVFDALYRMETLERTAHILHLARQLGGEKPLPATAASRLEKFFDGAV